MGLMVLIATSCDDDCPVCPGEDEIISDYDIFISNPYGDSGGFLIYNTVEKAVVDSIPYTTPWRDAAVSADGQHLMLTTRVSPNDTFIVYDIQTMQRIKSILGEGYIEVSYTGAYIALLDDEGLVFLDGQTYDILFDDPIYCPQGRFLPDDSRFYTYTDPRHIRIYDMIGESLYVDLEYMLPPYSPPIIYSIQPSRDGCSVFMIISFGSEIWKYLISYNIELDSTAMFYPISFGGAGMAITPDGQKLIITDHSEALYGYPATEQIIFFDANTQRVIDILSAGSSIIGQTYTGFSPGAICITPDCNFALVGPSGSGPRHVFALVDLNKYRFSDIIIEPLENRTITNVFCKKFR